MTPIDSLTTLVIESNDGTQPTDDSSDMSSTTLRVNSPLWNYWARLDPDAAYWAKVFYSNLSYGPATSVDGELRFTYDPAQTVSVDNAPLIEFDLPVADWRELHQPAYIPADDEIEEDPTEQDYMADWSWKPPQT